MKIKVKLLNQNARMPEYAHLDDAGMDIFSAENKIIQPRQTVTIGTAIALEFPTGFVGRVLDRSSWGVTGIHTFAGVIDSGYRGEYKIVLHNSTDLPFEIKQGDKIAQIVFYKFYRAEIQPSDELTESDRGKKGFGSTDKIKPKIKN